MAVESRQQNGASSSGEHEFKEGERVIAVAAFDKKQHVGVVVAMRVKPNTGPQAFVHFEDYDKRCDEWIASSHLIPHTDELAKEVAVRPSHELDEEEVNRGGRRKRARLQSGVLLPLDAAEVDAEEEHRKAHPLRARYTEFVEFGKYELKTWYFSPYPPEFSQLERIFVCPFTMKYFRKRRLLDRHMASLTAAERRPPGDCIYTSPLPNSIFPLSTADNPQITPACDPQVRVYEVDGAKAGLYCQNLCLLSKLFLDGKTLVWEVHEFVFYVLCEKLPTGDEMVGYFSREKKSEINHLACILTLPHKQSSGYGGFIIDVSYELARRRERPGTPERPFSDLGEAAFKEYWERTLVAKLAQVPQKQTVNLNDLAIQTGIMKEDILLAIGDTSRVRELRLCKYVQQQWHAEVRDHHALMELFDLVCNGKRRLIVDEGSLFWLCEAPRRGRG